MPDLSQRLVSAVGPRRTAKEIAEAIHQCLTLEAQNEGMTPEIEVVFRRPGEERYFDDTSCYCIAWEAGPSDWGYAAAHAIREATGAEVTAKHSFDVCIHPGAAD